MPTIIQTEVFTYDELNDNAKEKARQWAYEGAFDYNWWEATYEDAERVGLKITSCNLGRRRHAKGTLTMSAIDCCMVIRREHTAPCKTLITAENFIGIHDGYHGVNGKITLALRNDPEADISELEKEYTEQEAVFLKAILEDYSVMLQKEREYMGSEEYLAEHIRGNEYTFMADGKRFG